MLSLLRFREMILSCSALVTLAACGSAAPNPDHAEPRPETAFASELQPLLESYEADAAAASVPVPEEFKSQLVQMIWVDDLGVEGGETVLGRCDRINEQHPDPALRFRTVKVRRPDAQGKIGGITLDALTLKTIVYHELGHCLHDFRGHLPESSHQIMSSALPAERFASFQQLAKAHFALVHNH